MSECQSPRDRLIGYSLLPWMTPARCRLLRESFESWTDVRQAPATFLQTLLRLDDPEQIEEVRDPLRSDAARRLVAAVGQEVVTLIDDAYPPLLREICDPPLALYFRGDLAAATRPAVVAVVGSRKASPYAINAASLLTSALAAAGAAIVSGLARGIDAAAHRAALDAGGTTIAVLGTGIDVIYPRNHKRLFHDIAERGLVVTEFPPGTPPLPPHFPIRNRVISGLAHGTMVVEATGRSGSLITARTAAEQGREVFAVPGSIFSPGSEGTHRLIQYGAKLIHDAQDVLEELPGNLAASRSEEEAPPSTLASVLAAFSRDEGTHVDRAALALHRSVSDIAEPLLQLELGGWLRALPGGRYVRVR
jgi:DNA processing protein